MKYLLILLMQTFALSNLAQNETYFKHITSDEGLPANYVETITQTHDGFMGRFG